MTATSQAATCPAGSPSCSARPPRSGLADRRGECIHAACPHWKKCFVEHTIRRARSAELVVANHALVMAQAAWGGLDDGNVPTRYVFDEGHHVFDAADGAFAAELSGIEAAELRRWLLGRRGRPLPRARAAPARRGPRRRAARAGGAARCRAHRRPRPARARLVRPALRGDPPRARRLGAGPGQPDRGVPAPDPPPGARPHAGGRGARPRRRRWNATSTRCSMRCRKPPTALAPRAARIAEPLATLRARLPPGSRTRRRSSTRATRIRIEAVGRSLARRALDRLSAWDAMLRAVAEPPPEPGERPDHVLFLRARPPRGRGPRCRAAPPLARPHHPLRRHPRRAGARPARHLGHAARRHAGRERRAESAWEAAEARVGAAHLPVAGDPHRASRARSTMPRRPAPSS